MRGFGRVARRGGLVVACALVLGACVPVSVDTQSPPPTPPAEVVDNAAQERQLLDYTIDLPDGWNDLTDEYLATNDQSVLAGFWTMADDLSTDGPYVTVSLHALDPKADLSTLNEDAVKAWTDQLGDPVRGDSGYAETVDGGVVTWESISGDLDGARRTEHVAHIFYGPYYMYVEVDTPEGDEENAHAILDALSTVTISGPIKTGDRAGAPVPVDGRWASYCGTLTAAVQQGWQYQFTQHYDSIQWPCPQSSDYLGEWSVARQDGTYIVIVDRLPETTLSEALEQGANPSVVGGTATTEHGYTVELLAREPFTGPGGGNGVIVDTETTAPGGSLASGMRNYLFEDEAGGVTEVYVYDALSNGVPDSAWLEPFIATLATP